MRQFLFICALITMPLLTAKAQTLDPKDLLSDEEKIILEKIRTKNFIGGPDEGMLKVQTELNTQQSLLNSENSANQSNDEGF